MLEFVFGALFGAWAAQQFPLPSVHETIRHWWSKPTSVTPDADSEQEEEPTFTGEMPSTER